MAVTVTKSAQLADGARPYPIDDHGKIRFAYGKITQVGIGDIGSSVIFAKLPFGRVRLLPYLSRYKVTALGAARVMAIGHDAYYSTATPATADPVAAAAAAFASAVDVSGATEANFPVTGGIKHDLYSRDGVQLRATITGGTIPDGAVFEYCVAYVTE
jgi:hypothetical protein